MKSVISRAHVTPLALASACTILLAACGGGGSGSSSGSGGGSAGVQTTFSGTAATGAAMAGATIRVKCAAGTGTATTGSDGSFTLSLTDVTLPCAASATSANGATVLHSLANPDGGRTQVLNLSPLTQLLVARLAGTEPAAFYAAFDSSAAAKVTAGNITAALTALVTTLKDGGIDVAAIGNPITAALVAKTANANGNAHDQALDLLGARLTTAGTTLAQLASAVASGAIASNVTGLAPAQLLRPANANCTALRSGPYRWISPSEASAAWRSSTAQFDAANLTLTWHDGSTSTATSTGGCTFSAHGGSTKMVVSQAGVVVATSLTTSGRQVLSFGFPEQTVQLADLAGSWNLLEFNNYAAAGATPQLINEFTKVDIAADGKITAVAECVGLETCATQAGPFGSFSVSTAGGFSFSDSKGVTAPGDERAFIFRPANGEPMFVLVSEDNLIIASKARTLGLPAVGDVSNFWDISSTWQGVTSASFIDTSTTVTAVDSAAGSYTRRRASDGRVDGFTVNKPRNGLRHRPVSTSTLTNGSVVTLTEIITMPLPGTGLTVYGRITTDTTRSSGFYGVSVGKPN